MVCVLPGIATLIIGALGIVFGITELDELDGNEIPIAFIAATVKV